MDGPSNVCGQGSIGTAIGGARLPDELRLVLQQNVLVRSLDEIALNAEVGEYGKRGLRMPERVSGNGYPWVIVEFPLQEVQS
jgi:hypothetical protein